MPTAGSPGSELSLVLEPEGGPAGLSVTGALIRIPAAAEFFRMSRGSSDLGLGLVLDGGVPSAAEVIDLGSGTIRTMDLRRRLLVLDWVARETLRRIQRLAHVQRAVAAEEEAAARTRMDRVCFSLALQLLRRLGFDPCTRPTLLRIGFRDLCRDLDPHEGQAVRVLMEAGRVARIHLDCENVAVVVRTARSTRDPALEETLGGAFPSAPVRRFVPFGAAGSIAYRVSLPTPASLAEVREVLDAVRDGVLRILARFEPGRWRAVNDLLSTFGAPDTLASLAGRDREARSVALERGPFLPGAERIH